MTPMTPQHDIEEQKELREILLMHDFRCSDGSPNEKEVESAIYLITAHCQKRENLARIDERKKTKLPFTGDHANCPDKRTCIGYQNAESDLYNENLIRIAELSNQQLSQIKRNILE